MLSQLSSQWLFGISLTILCGNSLGADEFCASDITWARSLADNTVMNGRQQIIMSHARLSDISAMLRWQWHNAKLTVTLCWQWQCDTVSTVTIILWRYRGNTQLHDTSRNSDTANDRVIDTVPLISEWCAKWHSATSQLDCSSSANALRWPSTQHLSIKTSTCL